MKRRSRTGPKKSALPAAKLLPYAQWRSWHAWKSDNGCKYSAANPDKAAQAALNAADHTNNTAEAIHQAKNDGAFNGAKGDKGDKGETDALGPKGDRDDPGETGPSGAVLKKSTRVTVKTA